MLKAAIEKILSLNAPHIEEIEGRTYVDKDMTQIGKELRATNITMSNLSSLVDFIKKVNCWYCSDCFHKWYARAKRYASDEYVENKNFELYKAVLGIY